MSSNGLLTSNDVYKTASPDSSYFIEADKQIVTPSPLQIVSPDTTRVLTISEANNGTATIGNLGNVVIGSSGAVGGTVISVNGSLGLGRVYDTLYNLPTTPEGTPGLSEVLSVNNSAGSTQINMNNNKIVNCPTPTSSQDVANKTYVDGLNTTNVKLTGNQTISGVKTFFSLPESSAVPNTANQLVNKSYVDTRPAPATPTLAQVLTASNVANTDINVNGQKLLSVATPTLQGDGANKFYVDTLDGANVKLTGTQTISGVKTFNSLPECFFGPTTDSQLANKGYVDGLDIQNVKLTGNQTITGVKTFSNQMNLSNNKIVSLGAPTDANDAVTKTYVDTRIDRTVIRSWNTTLTTTVDSTSWTVPANGTYEVEVIVNSTGATLVAGGIYNTRIRAVGGGGFINNSTNFITATAMIGEGGFVISKHYYNVFLTRNFNTSPQNYEIQTYATAGSVSGGTVQINIYRLN